jgi:hypothetical protein
MRSCVPSEKICVIRVIRLIHVIRVPEAAVRAQS